MIQDGQQNSPRCCVSRLGTARHNVGSFSPQESRQLLGEAYEVFTCFHQVALPALAKPFFLTRSKGSRQNWQKQDMPKDSKHHRVASAKCIAWSHGNGSVPAALLCCPIHGQATAWEKKGAACHVNSVQSHPRWSLWTMVKTCKKHHKVINSS